MSTYVAPRSLAQRIRILSPQAKAVAVLAFLAYVGTVFLANLVVEQFGVVRLQPYAALGWTLMVPAAVYIVGVALVIRDLLHELVGWEPIVAAILLGAALSYFFTELPPEQAGPVNLAIASGVAFLVSELLDLAVFVPLRQRGKQATSKAAGRRWALAALVSSFVGLIVDSIVFLYLAFGDLAFLKGNVVGKLTAVVLAVGVAYLLRPLWAPRFSPGHKISPATA